MTLSPPPFRFLSSFGGLVLVLLPFFATATSAQVGNPFANNNANSPKMTLSAEFKLKSETREGLLYLHAKIIPSHHIYSVTQPKGGPLASQIKVTPSDQFILLREFASDKPPYIDDSRDIFDVNIEYHKDKATWFAPIQLSDDVDPQGLTIEIVYDGQICEIDLQGNTVGCLNLDNLMATAKFKGYDADLIIPAVETKNDSLPGDAGVSDQSVNAREGVATEEDEVVTPEIIEKMNALYNVDSKIVYIHYDEMDQYPVGSFAGASRDGSKPKTSLLMALVGMFLGGMLLNLMPCVFPVLGLKVMGFVEQAGSDPVKIRMHGIVFSLGLLVSMWVLAGFILSLKIFFGQNVSWGEMQLGNPYFVLGIIVLLFLLGLNMAGIFEFGTSLTRVGGKLDGSKGYSSSFLTGVLTTVIATPCSGPFLGTAMGYTLAQPLEIAMLLFTVFAFGIAFPYIVLCFFPALISALPRPGAWMHTFKVIMAFALFATAAFFMQSFGSQTGVTGLSWLVMALVVIALAAFFYGTWSPAYVKPYKRLLYGWVLPSIVLATGIWMGVDAAGHQNTEQADNQMVDGLRWNKWYPGRIEYSLQQKPKIIWVDYTASWCMTCIANKKATFGSTEVKKRIGDLDVELIKVDNTLREKNIAIELMRSDQAMIPVNIIYPPNYPEEPAILLNGVMTHWHALKVFDRMEAIQQKLDREK